LPRFFRKQAKDNAESNGNTCGFFVHRNASSHSELTFYSQFFGKYRRSPNLNGIPRAENFVNTSGVNKVADNQGEAITRAFRVGTITPNVSHPIYGRVVAVKSQARKRLDY